MTTGDLTAPGCFVPVGVTCRPVVLKGKRMHPAGQVLTGLREKLGFTLKDVEAASAKIAEKYAKDYFLVPRGVLDDIERKESVPSVHHLYSLSVIYRSDIRHLLGWYGVELKNVAEDLSLVSVAKSHLVSGLDSAMSIEVPVEMDPAFDSTRTVDIPRMIVRWDSVPFAYLRKFAQTEYAYAYIGTEDWTMYPLIPPGSFLQIDKTKNEITTVSWQSLSESPIYFVETKDGYTCCLCSLDGDNIVLHPHGASRQPTRVLRHQDAMVIGQVVAAAIRFDGDVRTN